MKPNPEGLSNNKNTLQALHGTYSKESLALFKSMKRSWKRNRGKGKGKKWNWEEYILHIQMRRVLMSLLMRYVIPAGG